MGIFSPYALQAGFEGDELATQLRVKKLQELASRQKMDDEQRQRKAKDVFGQMLMSVLGPQGRVPNAPPVMPQTPAPGQASVPMQRSGVQSAAPGGQASTPMPQAPGDDTDAPIRSAPTSSGTPLATPEPQTNITWPSVFEHIRRIAPDADGTTVASIAEQFAPIIDNQQRERFEAWKQQSQLDEKRQTRADRLFMQAQEQERYYWQEKQRSEDKALDRAQRDRADANAAEAKRDHEETLRELARIRSDDRTTQALAKTKVKAIPALNGAMQDVDSLVKDARELIKHKGLAAATGVVQSHLPTWRQDTADFEEALNSFKSKVGFAGLSRMRQLSPTGGALGNVSNYESQQLQNAVAALSLRQGDTTLPKKLQEVIDYATTTRQNLLDAYETTYGEPFAAATPKPRDPNAPTGGSVPTGEPDMTKAKLIPPEFVGDPEGMTYDNADGSVWIKRGDKIAPIGAK